MPSPSASPISKSKYDVFLSFRGEDTRHSIVSHLYAALSSRGIVTFKDDKRLEIGDHISDELHRAIEGSDFVVVVLSENYATSRWCLMELQLIMELHMERRLDVIPVFYRVEPSDVRHQLGSFDLQRYQDDPQMADKVPRWREALKLIADLSGVESKLCIDEATMVGKIAKDMIVKAKVKHFDIVGTKSMAEREVDVFLSYSCKTDETEHFEYHLVQNGTTTHKSYSYLERRVIPMDQCTFKALEHVKVAVVVISDTKPCSVGFLEELKVILDFEEKGSLTVIPIFLTPTRVDDVSEKIFQEYPENAPSWRTALTKLAKIASKYPFSQGLAGEELPHQLKQIAHDIFLLLLSSISNDFNGLVAMDRHMKVVYDLLASKANKEVHTIGIWGSAGVGKTTLARYIYAEISVNFQTNVFLKDVKNLREKILKFEGDGDPTVIISSDYNGHEITQARCKHRKVLLIADDVKNIEQGKWIIEYANWFAPGSRVILISQTKNLLVDAGVKHAYEVRSLRYDEALQLFSHFAFKQPDPPSDFEQLAVCAVHLAGFIPLALRLLGSFLTGKDRKEWVAALLKLKANQGGNIMQVWKLMEPSGDKGQEEWEMQQT